MRHQLLAMWCVPRSRSTAFLRAMVERGDLTVMHEPFSRVQYFGEVEVGDATCSSERQVIRALLALAESGPVFFKETMDFRYPNVLTDRSFLRAATHSVMVRRPEAVVASYLNLQATASRSAMGFENLTEVHDAARDATGRPPFVVDGDRLAADPESTITAYCHQVGIPFRPDALRWEAGSLPQWEQFAAWHETAALTTTFVQTEPQPLPEYLRKRAEEYVAYHQPFYDRLVTGRRG